MNHPKHGCVSASRPCILLDDSLAPTAQVAASHTYQTYMTRMSVVSVDNTVVRELDHVVTRARTRLLCRLEGRGRKMLQVSQTHALNHVPSMNQLSILLYGSDVPGEASPQPAVGTVQHVVGDIQGPSSLWCS